MSSNNSLLSIQKLTGRENYNTWRFAVKTYLQHEELWECVEGTDNDTKKENKAKTKIILLIDPINYVHIEEAKTAKEVWANLSHAFDDSGLTRRVGLLRDLCTTTLTGCQNVEDYVSKIMTTAHKLRNIGFKVDDEWLGTMLLSGLPEQYKPMIMAVESSGIAITSDAIKAKILQDVKDEKDTKAFAANKSGQNNTNSKKKPRCFNCNKYGHYSKNCRTNKNNKKENPSSYSAVFMASQNNKDDKSWFVDSGASCHMTKHKEWLQEMITPPIRNIKVANDKTLPVKSCGQISLDVLDGKGQQNKILCKNVLYVPELATNLLSVSQIIKNGGQVKFNSEGCVILNKLNTVVATANLVNNMYRLSTEEAHACISVVDEQDAYLWHQRMGHLNFRDLEKLKDCTHGVSFKKQADISCITCLEGKQARLPFNHEGTRASQLLELVHSDLCGPMETTSLGGAKYFLTFTDDFSRKVFVYTLHNKTEVLEKFKNFKNESENYLERKIKCLRTDNGTEFINKEFSQYLKKAGIIHQTSIPYSAQQNGLAERMNRTLVEKAKCMLLNAKLHKHFWAEALLTAAHVYNRSPTRTLSFKTPEEMWKGTKPNVSHLRIFGCEAMVHTPKEKAKKWDAKGQKMIFIGYCEHSKGYRFIKPNTKTVIKSRDVVFLESTVEKNCVPVKLTESPSDIDSADDSCNETLTSTNTILESSIDTSEDSEFLPAESIDSPNNAITMTLRSRSKNSSSKTSEKEENSYLCVEEARVNTVPLTYYEAITSADADQWKKAIDDELEAHHRNGTWNLVVKPADSKLIGCKWVFRIKDEPSGLRYKARLCAKGYSQKAGLDYNETFSPTVRYDSIRLLLSIAVQQNLHLIQFDVKTAFLYGVVQEHIFMSVPEGLKAESNMVCKLDKALYGLKQAPRCWNEKFDYVLKKYGFIKSQVDQCVYIGLYKDVKCYLLIYVDDGLLFAQEEHVLNDILNDLKTNFEITTCKPTNYVGMQLEICKNSIFIHQTKYINQLLNKFNMTDANPNSVPADPHVKLNKPESLPGKNIPYREAVGSLMHTAIVSRPDIMFAVSLVSRFLNNHNESHWNAVKKIFKYLNATKSYGLCYKQNENHDLVGYSDADYANDVESRRSVTGYVFIKNGAAVTWCSQRQQSVALSTTEAEFMAACAATKEAMWLKQLLCDLGEFKQNSVCLNIDNQSAISVIKNIDFHKRCKHIDVRYNFVKEKYLDKVIDLSYVCSEKQYADMFTKPLTKDKYQINRCKIGMISKQMIILLSEYS